MQRVSRVSPAAAGASIPNRDRQLRQPGIGFDYWLCRGYQQVSRLEGEESRENGWIDGAIAANPDCPIFLVLRPLPSRLHARCTHVVQN